MFSDYYCYLETKHGAANRIEENLDARAMEGDGDESALDEREATDFRDNNR